MKPALLLFALAPNVASAEPRIAVMSAFPPESVALEEGLAGAETDMIDGNTSVIGTLEEQVVVLVFSGTSMINAAMTTQLALDRFEIEAIAFSGIAGGVDPDL